MASQRHSIAPDSKDSTFVRQFVHPWMSATESFLVEADNETGGDPGPKPLFAECLQFATTRSLTAEANQGGHMADDLSNPARKQLHVSVATLAPQELVDDSIPAFPEYFDVSTSFTSLLSPGLLFVRLFAILAQFERAVIQTVNKQTKHVCGEVTYESQAYNFDVQFYHYSDSSLCLVEFHRTFGDGFGFNSFFHDICDKMHQDIHEVFSKRLPSQSDDMINEDSLPCAVEALCSMALAPQVDVSRQGINALMILSTQASIPADAAMLAVIDHCSKSSDWETRRCVATLVCNLSTAVNCRDVLVSEPSVSALSNLLHAPSESHSTETQLQVCMAVSRLCETHRNLLVKQDSFSRLISSTHCSSPEVKNLLDTVRQQAQAAH